MQDSSEQSQTQIIIFEDESEQQIIQSTIIKPQQLDSYVEANMIAFDFMREQIKELKNILVKMEKFKQDGEIELGKCSRKLLVAEYQYDQALEKHRQVIEQKGRIMSDQQQQIIKLQLEREKIKSKCYTEIQKQKEQIKQIINQHIQTIKDLDMHKESLQNQILYLRSQVKRSSDTNARQLFYIQQLTAELNEMKTKLYQKSKQLQGLYDIRTIENGKFELQKQQEIQNLQLLLLEANQRERQHEAKIKQLKRQLEEKQQNECVICNVNPITSGCFPCGHINFCTTCVSQLRNKCPICKARVTGTFKFYK